MKIRTILVPVDFSTSAARALETASGLAKQLGAKIVLLHAYHVEIPKVSKIIPGIPALPPGFFDRIREHATEQLEALGKQISEEGVDVSSHVMPEPASVSIIEDAERLEADLIVMGTRGTTGLEHVVLGSVAERVIRTAPCPVITVRAEHGD